VSDDATSPAPGPSAGGWRPAIVLPPSANADRWAHRRGEPRVFVLLWTTFLFTATLLTLTGVGLGGYVTADVYRPAARMLMLTVAAGIALLWPMIRLSQDTPAHAPAAATAQDVFIVLLPTQAVIWPQYWLAGWPIPVLLAISALLTAWALVVGGVLALALGRLAGAGHAARAWWMVGLLVLTTWGALGAFLDRGDQPGMPSNRGRVAWMLSPLTGVAELTRDRSWTGRPAAVYREHVLAILWTAGIAAPLWVAAASRRGRSPVRGLH
jgi:hypothetical protein